MVSYPEVGISATKVPSLADADRQADPLRFPITIRSDLRRPPSERETEPSSPRPRHLADLRSGEARVPLAFPGPIALGMTGFRDQGMPKCRTHLPLARQSKR